MAATGNSFETPHACPFVALELDRDKRADKPDYRHRCFAEPTPAPRSLAHQEAFCLSPNFAGCPIFQDWAVRAAARPTATGGTALPGAAGVASVLATAAAGASDMDEVAPMPPELATPAPMEAPAAAAPSAATDLPEDASVTPAGAALAAAAAASTGAPPTAAASPPTFATTGWEDEAPDNEQLGAFDAPPAGAVAAAGAAAASRGDWPTSAPADDDAHSSYGEPDAGYPEPPVAPAFVPPPAQPSSSNRQEAAAAAAVPAFLAGRTPRPADTPSYSASSIPPPRPTPPPAREEIVPSWEIDGRYGAEMPLDQGSGGGSRFDGVLTAVAVIAILAIGVAAVLFLPGLLNSKGAPAQTTRPSFATASGVPTVAPSVLVTVAPSSVPSAAPQTAVPTTPASLGPEATPHLYRIKPGDSLARIANKFDVTVQQILDANPQITDPDHILVGFTIIIPPAVVVTIPPTAAP